MLVTDARRALRTVLRRPGMSAALVATMALGIGATTAVFSVIDGVLLRGVPFTHPSEIVELWATEPGGFSHPRLDAERAGAWSVQPRLFAHVEKYADRSLLVTGAGDAQDVRGTAISPGLLPMLGVSPVRGRGFTPDDAAASSPYVAIVSEAFYNAALGAEPLENHPVVRLNETPYVVIGVMPSAFRYPRGVVSVWLPLREDDTFKPSDFSWVARLRPGVTHEQARAQFAALGKQLDATAPKKGGLAVRPNFVDQPLVNRDVRVALWVLAAAVACVLLVACVNTANLLLVQGAARQREFAIRGALGASRGRLVRQLLVESALLALPAVALGVAVAFVAVRSIVTIMPSKLSLFGATAVTVDTRVLLFSTGAGLATWLLCGVGAAGPFSRARTSLVSGQRPATGSRRMRRVRNGLVIVELALSLVLLAGAGLFVRSLHNLLAVDPGFDAAHTLVADLRIPRVRYATPAQRAAVIAEVERAVRAVPGVQGVTLTTGLPPHAGIMFGARLEAEGSAAPAKTGDVVIPRSDVDTAFFSTLHVPLLRGRAFTASDVGSSMHPVIIDPGLARALWASGDPIGKRFHLDADDPWMTVIGVSANVKLMGADDRANPYSVLFPHAPTTEGAGYLSIAVRTASDPVASIRAVTEAVRSVSALLPLTNVGSAATEFAEGNAKPRFVLVLMSVFAGLALVLAAIGVYGVLSYAVLQRTREIGIRMAIGARGADIVAAMLREGTALALAGTAIGLGATALTTRMASSLLFGVAPLDVGVLAVVCGVLVVTALVAMLAPTLRASRVNPLVAMTPD